MSHCSRATKRGSARSRRRRFGPASVRSRFRSTLPRASRSSERPSGRSGELGGADVLVNSAATDAPWGVENLTASDWDRVLAVNLRAPFLLSKAVLPSMRDAGRGTIVNVSSVAGKRGWAHASAYCVSKFALAGFTQALAAEGKAHGIRACVLFPGGMATGWGAWSADERHAPPREPPPATQSLPPEVLAALIVWIAAAPKELVLNEVIATPLEEQGWP
jgi:NAD(P)-dependent dehydrogenase (short-subunit alcohol dehydrogenase family)